MNLYAAFATWLDQQAEHEVTLDHLKLLARLNLCWCTYVHQGAPGVDPAHIFGNRDFEHDIADILDWEPEGPEDADGFRGLSDHQRLECVRLLGELAICLQILASTLSLCPGRYARADKWSTGRYTCWSCALALAEDSIIARNRAAVRNIHDQLTNPVRQKNWPDFLKTRHP